MPTRDETKLYIIACRLHPGSSSPPIYRSCRDQHQLIRFPPHLRAFLHSSASSSLRVHLEEDKLGLDVPDVLNLELLARLSATDEHPVSLSERDSRVP